LGDDRNVFLGEELLHNKQCVARCVIVMQKPLSMPLVAPISPNCIAQPLQNLHVEMTSNTPVQAVRTHGAPNSHSPSAGKFRELFDCPSQFDKIRGVNNDVKFAFCVNFSSLNYRGL
jgi:hypothetical protein